MTKTAQAPSESDLNTATELDAMADLIHPVTLTDEERCSLDDLAAGRYNATDRAARQLRVRAAELRGLDARFVR